MNRYALACLLGLAVALLGGCSFVPTTALRAEPIKSAQDCGQLDHSSDDWKTKNCTEGTQRSRSFQLMQDSVEKCNAFLAYLFKSEAGTSTGLDIAALSLAALSPVFSDTQTKNVLAAGSAIATGSKNSINTEYLNSLTLANLSQAVNTSYYVQVGKYRDYLDTLTAPDVDEVRADLLRIHALCSLPAAEGTIQATLAPTAAQTTTTSSKQLTFVYEVKKGDDQSNLVANFVTAFNADPTFKAADIQAQATTTTTIVFVQSKSTWHSISWKPVLVAGPSGHTPAIDPNFSADFTKDTSTVAFAFKGSPAEGSTITLKTDQLIPEAARAATPPPVPAPKPGHPAPAPAPAPPAAPVATQIPNAPATVLPAATPQIAPPGSRANSGGSPN